MKKIAYPLALIVTLGLSAPLFAADAGATVNVQATTNAGAMAKAKKDEAAAKSDEAKETSEAKEDEAKAKAAEASVKVKHHAKKLKDATTGAVHSTTGAVTGAVGGLTSGTEVQADTSTQAEVKK